MGNLELSLQPASLSLALRPEPQVCYILLTIDAPGSPAAWRAVNWALVADASRSMRIPIISEEQFRQLVRAGGAHEVLVDGVPVWQFSSPVPPEIDASSPSALDYVMQALYSVVEHLHSDDRFALVACAEEAVLLAPSTSGAERALLTQHIDDLYYLDLGEETSLSSGIRLGLEELQPGRGRAESRVERLILLTDGFTQQPESCLSLARQAAAEGVSVSTLGLGGDFQDDLLTAMADVSGGRAVFLRRAEEIPQAVAHELTLARSVTAQALTLTITLSSGVVLRRATSISPTLAVLDPLPLAPAIATLRLGDLHQSSPVRVLLELLAPPAPHLGDMPSRRMRLARLRCTSEAPRTDSTLDLIATYTTAPDDTPAAVLEAAARANAVRLQRRAIEAAAQGDHQTAVMLLRQVAARLQELGEAALANLALHEADMLQRTGQTTRLGAKELTYATRRLGKR